MRLLLPLLLLAACVRKPREGAVRAFDGAVPRDCARSRFAGYDGFDEEWREKMAPAIAEENRRNLEALKKLLTPEERAKVGDVTVESPDYGAHCDPFDFYASPATRVITLPNTAMRLNYDMTRAYALMAHQRLNLSAIHDYVIMLKYRDPKDFPGGVYPRLFDALGLDYDAVPESAADHLMSTSVFIMGHELGHLLYGHKAPGVGSGTLDELLVAAKQAKEQETQADAFGLEMLSRAARSPIGISLALMPAYYWAPNQADYDGPEAYARYLATAHHPRSADRLLALADQLDLIAPRYAAALTPDPLQQRKASLLIRVIADGYRTGARLLAREIEQSILISQARTFDIPELTRRAKLPADLPMTLPPRSEPKRREPRSP